MSGLPVPPCTQTGFAKLSNSLGQSPCYIATALVNACSPAGSAMVFPPLNSSHPVYGGVPVGSSFNPCLCSSVFYSLLSACNICQTNSLLDWSSYSNNCNSISFSSFPRPIPQGTSVPHYAYLDVKASDGFNCTAALLSGGPESSPISSMIQTTVLVTSTRLAVVTVNATSTAFTMTASASLGDTRNGSFTGTTSQPTLTPTQTSKGGPNIGVIIGPIIGVVAFIALLAFAGFMFFHRKSGVTVRRLASDHSLVNVEQYSRQDDGQHLLQNDGQYLRRNEGRYSPQNDRQYSPRNNRQYLPPNDGQYSLPNDGQYSLRSEGRHSFQDERQPPLHSGDQYYAMPKTDDWDQYSLLDFPVRPNPLPPREDTGEEVEDTMRYASNE